MSKHRIVIGGLTNIFKYFQFNIGRIPVNKKIERDAHSCDENISFSYQ